ncbi:MAG: hypothetical protein LE168_01035 [Endomicrobium sp.]|nr:hypothetical protein [Endomicrobium sp.]
MLEFSKLWYETLSAINSEDATSKINAERVRIVITDMKIPKVAGLDLLKSFLRSV